MANAHPTILVIDDEPLILLSISTLLSYRYEVITAEDGVSGLTMFNESHPALVLLDINLPMMNGVEVLARIRETDRDVPVVVMTGRRETVLGEISNLWTKQCAELAISGYVIKPISPDKLLKQIDKIMNRRMGESAKG